MVPNADRLLERYIEGLPLSIKGNVTSSKPVDLHEAIDMAQGLMYQVPGKVLMLASYLTAESVDDTTLTHALLLVTTVERQDIRPKTDELYLALQTNEDPEAKEDMAVMLLVSDVVRKDITRTSVQTMGIKVVEIKFEAIRKTLRTIKGKIKETLKEVTKHQPALKEDAEHLPKYTTYVLKPRNDMLIIQGERSGIKSELRLEVISSIRTQKYIDQGCQVFLIQMMKEEKTKILERRIKDVPEQSLKGLHKGLLNGPNGDCAQVEFHIERIPRVAPVARAPYRLAPTEMKELSEQLKELSDK
ncbi:hypothetical protein Tco_1545264, partial [Tanacetum coccineum]